MTVGTAQLHVVHVEGVLEGTQGAFDGTLANTLVADQAVSSLILVMAGNVVAADIKYTDAGADHLWTNSEHWKDAAGPPTTADDGAAFNQPDTSVHINQGR